MSSTTSRGKDSVSLRLAAEEAEPRLSAAAASLESKRLANTRAVRADMASRVQPCSCACVCCVSQAASGRSAALQVTGHCPLGLAVFPLSFTTGRQLCVCVQDATCVEDARLGGTTCETRALRGVRVAGLTVCSVSDSHTAPSYTVNNTTRGQRRCCTARGKDACLHGLRTHLSWRGFRTFDGEFVTSAYLA